MLRSAVAVASLGLSLLASAAARADGCDEGERPLTFLEQAFFAKVASLKEALPAAPAGWTRDEPTVSAPEGICRGLDPQIAAGRYRLTGAVGAVYRRDGADQQIAEAASPALPPEVEKELQRLLEQQTALAVRLAEASQANDIAAVNRLGADLDALTQKAAALGEKAAAPDRAKLAAAARNSIAVVAIELNAEGLGGLASCADTRKIAAQNVAGGYRAECPTTPIGGSDDAPVAGESVLLFGSWDHELKSGKLRAAPRFAGKQPYTEAQAADVRVRADEPTAGALLRKIRLEPIRAALAR